MFKSPPLPGMGWMEICITFGIIPLNSSSILIHDCLSKKVSNKLVLVPGKSNDTSEL